MGVSIPRRIYTCANTTTTTILTISHATVRIQNRSQSKRRGGLLWSSSSWLHGRSSPSTRRISICKCLPSRQHPYLDLDRKISLDKECMPTDVYQIQPGQQQYQAYQPPQPQGGQQQQQTPGGAVGPYLFPSYYSCLKPLRHPSSFLVRHQAFSLTPLFFSIFLFQAHQQPLLH